LKKGASKTVRVARIRLTGTIREQPRLRQGTEARKRDEARCGSGGGLWQSATSAAMVLRRERAKTVGVTPLGFYDLVRPDHDRHAWGLCHPSSSPFGYMRFGRRLRRGQGLNSVLLRGSLTSVSSFSAHAHSPIGSHYVPVSTYPVRRVQLPHRYSR